NDISKILDVRRWKSETYYFDNATEQRLKTLQNPGVVHIATHGYFNDDPDNVDPLYSSGIFLTRSDESENDGILTAYEAMNLVLDETNLVVLAACETGLGTIQNGEGVFGLQRAFLVAGAKNVLISLVKINDNAARTFMNLYYEQLKELQDAQKAFFAARTAFKKMENDPYNWGAYILVSKSL
ncbi:MAG: CHAT domain-containing protein, partial [Cyclobacteriaceae bacterium]